MVVRPVQSHTQDVDRGSQYAVLLCLDWVPLVPTLGSARNPTCHAHPPPAATASFFVRLTGDLDCDTDALNPLCKALTCTPFVDGCVPVAAKAGKKGSECHASRRVWGHTPSQLACCTPSPAHSTSRGGKGSGEGGCHRNAGWGESSCWRACIDFLLFTWNSRKDFSVCSQRVPSCAPAT